MKVSYSALAEGIEASHLAIKEINGIISPPQRSQPVLGRLLSWIATLFGSPHQNAGRMNDVEYAVDAWPCDLAARNELVERYARADAWSTTFQNLRTAARKILQASDHRCPLYSELQKVAPTW
jgi:hypothetical protein